MSLPKIQMMKLSKFIVAVKSRAELYAAIAVLRAYGVPVDPVVERIVSRVVVSEGYADIGNFHHGGEAEDDCQYTGYRDSVNYDVGYRKYGLDGLTALVEFLNRHKLRTFQIPVREIMVRNVTVCARTPEEARELVRAGQGDFSAPAAYSDLSADEYFDIFGEGETKEI